MKIQFTIFGWLLLVAVVCATAHTTPPGESPTADFEKRCGWFSNPTPANVTLYDRDNEWTIGVQGGYQVSGDWDWPVFKRSQWVRTNRDYGYGCVCMDVRVNKQTQEVQEIKKTVVRPLATCRQDTSLKKWKKMLE